MKKRNIFWVCLGLCMVLMVSPAVAQWIYVEPDIIPPRHPQPFQGIKTVSMKIQGDINNQAGTIAFEQVLFNPNPYQLEGTFYFPLPKGGSIKDFAMYVNGEKISGEILESGKARQIYEDIVRKMRDPAILEYMDTNVFRCRIFPIPPRGEIRVEIITTHVLGYDSGNIFLSLPLKQVSSFKHPLKNLVIDLRIRSDRPIGNFYSPSFDMEINPSRDGSYRVSYEGTNISLDRDFSLYYRYMDNDIGLSAIGYRPHETQGYFMLFISPTWDITPRSMSAKEIIYVVDCSGSMRKNKKLDQVKAALSFGLNGLNSNDKFNIIAFSSESRQWRETLVKANRSSINEAEDYVSRLDARGGTNIFQAINLAMSMFSKRNVPKILVFLTDGLPTVGVTSPDKIYSGVSKLGIDDVRIFSFGVGYDVNTFLLDKISELQHGSTTYIEPEENLELKLSSFFEKIEFPVLSKISIDFGNFKVSDIYPAQLPDLFKGSQLTVVGRYTNPGATTITLRGTMQGREKSFRYRVSLPGKNRQNDFLPHLWATRKVGFLLDEIRLNGESEELVNEVIRLSKKYGIPTPYTSYLVTDDQVKHYAQGPNLDSTTRQPLAPGGSVRPKTDSMKKLAVKEAKIIQNLKNLGNSPGRMELESADSIWAGEGSSGNLTRVGGKTFLDRDGWITDTEFNDDLEIIKIKFLSNAYFQLLSRFPELLKYLSLGNNIKLALNEMGIIVSDEGLEKLSHTHINLLKRSISQ